MLKFFLSQKNYRSCIPLALLVSIPGYSAEVELNWTPTIGADGYIVSYDENPGVPYANTLPKIIGNSQTTAKIQNLQSGRTYFFAVKAYAGTKESIYSNEFSAAIPNQQVPVTVDFSTSVSTGNAALATTFTPTVSGPITDWTWDFKNGNVLSGVAPNMPTTYLTSYKDAGIYNVVLSANPGPVVKTVQITVAPVAGFSANTLSGSAPLTVAFADKSAGTPNGWAWNFGDNTSDTVANPSHTFSAPGTYTVSLKVSGNGITSGNTATQTIKVSTAPPPDIGGGGSSPGGQPQLSASGLVAAYSFEEGVGKLVADASGRGNSGTVSSARWTTVSGGKFGRAMYFNGKSSLITIPDAPALRLSTGMTLESWVYPLTADYVWRDIIQKGDDNYYLMASTEAGTPAGTAQVTTNGANPRVHAPTPLPAFKWTHIAVTYDQKNLRFYRDGIEVSQAMMNGLIVGSNAPLQLGGDSIYGQYFNGYIDEVRVYNKALSGEEIVKDKDRAISVANPVQPVVGKMLSPTAPYLMEKGVIHAYPVSVSKAGTITSLPVFLDKASASRVVIAGVYEDNDGRPGRLKVRGAISAPRPGQWNSILLPATQIDANQRYWVAVLSPNGSIALGASSGSVTVEMSPASKVYSSMPSSWEIGGPSSSMQTTPSAYAAGY